MTRGETRQDRIRHLQEENEELRQQLKVLVSGAGIVVRCWREGQIPEDIFYEALEETVAKSGAELIAGESAANAKDDG